MGKANELLFVHLITSSHYIEQGMSFWESRCKHLYDSRISDSVIFFPSSVTEEIFVRGKRKESFWYPVPGCRHLVKSVHIHDSKWLKNHSSAVARCASTTWSRDYAMYSGAFFAYHLLREPILKRYKFYVKIDMDICVHRKIPLELLFSNDSRTLVSHTSIVPSSDCERNVLQATRAYKLKMMDTRRTSAWCDDIKLREIIYGNFVVFNSTFMTSKSVLNFTNFLYNSYGKGYFEYRWGDQALVPSLLCGVAPLPGVSKMSLDPRVRNLKILRAAGLGDADLAKGKVVPIRRRVIEAQAVTSWAQLHAA